MSVTITGTGFVGVTNVSFGGTPAGSYNVVSPTRIVAVAPSGSVGSAAVSVTNTYGAATQTQNFIYAEPPVISPAAGALTAGVVGVNYTGTTFTATAGISPYAFALATGNSLPPGLSLNGSTGVVYGTPSIAGNYSFIVEVTDGNSETDSAVYTMVIGELPIASDSSATVPANSTNNPVTPNVSGGTPDSVAIVTPATKGTVTVSGTSFTYTPNPGYSGPDSFSYTATNTTGTSSTATVTITVSAPTLVFSPAAGALPAGTEDVLYPEITIAVSDGATPYTFALASGGGLPDGLLFDTSTAKISGTPTTAGNYSFTIDVTDDNGATGAVSYTLAVSEQIPVAGAVFTAVPVNSTNNPIQLVLSGGTPASVAIGTLATNGVATVSGTSITYTPNAGYAGPDSFTYTATNTAGTSAPATVTITVDVPTLTISPATLSNGEVGVSYNDSITAAGGTLPYTYTIDTGSLPAGLTLATDGNLTGTPTAGGTYSFTVKAQDSSTGSGPFSAVQAYTITIASPTITLSPATLPDGSINASYSQTLVASGGTGTHSFAVTSGALPNGLLLSTAGALSGTPTVAGTFNITVTATDSSTGLGPYSGSQAYSLVIMDIAPVANAVSETFAANSVGNTVTLDITGGAASSVAVASGPANGAVTVSGRTVTYTPTAGFSGADSFSYTATNGTGTSAAATVSITVTPPIFDFAPTAGALPAGTIGTSYSQSVSASNGASPYEYEVTSGALPAGLNLSLAGAITGTPTSDGNYSFTITATDDYGATGSVAYTITIMEPPTFTFTPGSGALTQAMASEDYSQTITVTGGTAPLIYSLSSGVLPDGMVLNISTGELSGPLDAGTEGNYSFTIRAQDSNGFAGTASYTLTVAPRGVTVDDQVVNVPAGTAPNNVNLAEGATGGPFTAAEITFVEPANAGTLSIVNGEFAQAGGPGSLGWYLKFIPNGAFSGTVRVGYRLTSVLGQSNIGVITYNLSYSEDEVRSEISGLVQEFVRSRQNMISSSITIPGLLERRRIEKSDRPVTSRLMPSERGMTYGFSTSLAQLGAARNQADGIVNGESQPFNVWIDGKFLMHKRGRDSDGSDEKWGRFGMISAGADYLLSDKALIGLSVHYDTMSSPTDEDAELTGNGWLFGPYASFEVGKGVFWDTSLLYGGSANDIDTAFWDGSFETMRWMVDTSIKGQWKLDDVTILTPKLRAIYFSEQVDDYSVSNASGNSISIDGFTEQQLRVSLGAEIARQFTLESGTLVTPKLGVTGGFSGLDGAGAFGAVTAGVSVETIDEWSLDLSLLLNIESDDDMSAGARASMSRRF